MMLFGAVVWGRWAYLWVFLSVPICVAVLGPVFELIPGKEVGMLLFSLPMVVSYFLVRRYYRKRGKLDQNRVIEKKSNNLGVE